MNAGPQKPFISKGVKIATPISTIFEHTSRLEDILALSDELEFRDFSKPIAGREAKLFHCEASLIEPWSGEELDRIASIIKANNIELVTFHLKSRYINAPVAGGMFQPQGQEMSRVDMIRNAAANKQKLMEKLGRTVPFAVENNNYFPTPAYEIVTDAEFISELVRELDIYLLLDIAHVQVTAGNKKLTAADYLAGFDLSKVIQVHLSRPLPEGEIVRDSHEYLEDDDWRLSAEIMKRCSNLKYATVEYYRDDKKLISNLERLRKVIT